MNLSTGTILFHFYDSLEEILAHRKASIYTGQHSTEKRVPGAGFEPTIPVFMWSKTYAP